MGTKSFINRASKVAKVELLKIKYEHVFESEGCNLKYLFLPKKTSKHLLVVFSAFPSVNRAAGYNYVDTFKKSNCSRLYIMDNYGPNIRGGSYYLGENKDFFIQKAVSELIEEKTRELGLQNNNVITAGTSKGGFAALYFAFENSYGNAVVGAPQTLLGDYLTDNSMSALKYIMGEYTENNNSFLNRLLFDKVESCNGKPKVWFHVGKGENHYEKHAIPFCQHLEKHGVSYELDAIDYNEHSEVGKHYPTYALKSFGKILS